MTDRILIPLPGIGTLELSREAYEAALRPLAAPQPAATASPPAPDLVSAKEVARRMNLPLSCVYEYARAGRIPCVRAGRHVLFDPGQVLRALRGTSHVTGGHA